MNKPKIKTSLLACIVAVTMCRAEEIPMDDYAPASLGQLKQIAQESKALLDVEFSLTQEDWDEAFAPYANPFSLPSDASDRGVATLGDAEYYALGIHKILEMYTWQTAEAQRALNPGIAAINTSDLEAAPMSSTSPLLVGQVKSMLSVANQAPYFVGLRYFEDQGFYLIDSLLNPIGPGKIIVGSPRPGTSYETNGIPDAWPDGVYIFFHVEDAETHHFSLDYEVTSSNQNIVSNDEIVVSPNGWIGIFEVKNNPGYTLITLTVTDPAGAEVVAILDLHIF